MRTQLTREVRFALNPPPAAVSDLTGANNSWAGVPRMTGIVPQLALRVTIEGTPDELTGYLCDIGVIDNLVRRELVPEFARAVFEADGERAANPFVLLQQAWSRLAGQAELGKFNKITLQLSPQLSVELNSISGRIMRVLNQQFEFSAAHRLHCPSLSAEANAEIFGKCNNPHGHGHNYVIDVSVELLDDAGQEFPLAKLEQVVHQHVIDRLDHRNLNVEVAEFSELNPSVENIAHVIWRYVEEPLSATGSMRLVKVRVYETPKTWAEVTAA